MSFLSPSLQRVTGLLAVCTVLFASSVHAQADWSAKVLATRDLNQKEFLVCKFANKGTPTETLIKLLQREKHGPAVVSTAGQYFETNKLDGDSVGAIRLLARRSDIGDQGLAYVALSPSAPMLIKGFASSSSDLDQQIAAKLIAATAVMRAAEDRPNKRPAANVKLSGGRLNVNYSVELAKLLDESDDEIALEYALLAVGIDRVSAVKGSLAKHAKNREPAVAMAAQFALAATKGEIDQKAILNGLQRVDRRQKSRPALSYDTRQTPQVYAIMAAGEARLKEAVEPLLEQMKSEDLHTAVFAARALNRIGVKGIAVKMLKQMTGETLWPVRVAIYDAAGHNPDKQSVQLLLEQFDNESGRFRQDALYALLSIVAGKPEGMTIHDFKRWWDQNGEVFKIDIKATRTWRRQNRVGDAEVEEIAGFYESAVISERPVFAVDASLSMKGAQIESLQETLDNVVLRFPERVKFNIVDFGGHVRTLAPGGLIPARNRVAAMKQFKYEMKLTLGTRTYDAIESAMQLPEMDTVHFLSDGAPYGSHIKSWRNVDYATRLRCWVAPVAVHMIYFPENAGKGNKRLNQLGQGMKRYAENHAGQFHISAPVARDN